MNECPDCVINAIVIGGYIIWTFAVAFVIYYLGSKLLGIKRIC